MNKLILIATLLVIGGIVYVLSQARSSKPTIEVPDFITQPTEAPPAKVDYSQVKTEDIIVGTGVVVEDGKKVSVQYRGKLTDGTEFDSSYSRNSEPLEFVVGAGQMIPGFDYGVKGMKVGGTRMITIPPELGYGNRAQGDKIPANSTLVFEVVMEKAE